MDHVTALAESDEVGADVVGGVVIAMCCRQYDLRRAHDAKILEGRQCRESAALPITPGPHAGVPPAPIAEMIDRLPVRRKRSVMGRAGQAA